MAANTILAIENDAAPLNVLKDTLEQAGYLVHSADNAHEGLSKARELIPSIIFLNLATPGANGLEICKTIHSDESLKDVPLILLTLREGKFDPIYTKLYGIVRFIKKPLEVGELRSCVGEFAPIAPASPGAPTLNENMAEPIVTLADLGEEFSQSDTLSYADEDLAETVVTLADSGEPAEGDAFAYVDEDLAETVASLDDSGEVPGEGDTFAFADEGLAETVASLADSVEPAGGNTFAHTDEDLAEPTISLSDSEEEPAEGDTSVYSLDNASDSLEEIVETFQARESQETETEEFAGAPPVQPETDFFNPTHSQFEEDNGPSEFTSDSFDKLSVSDAEEGAGTPSEFDMHSFAESPLENTGGEEESSGLVADTFSSPLDSHYSVSGEEDSEGEMHGQAEEDFASLGDLSDRDIFDIAGEDSDETPPPPMFEEGEDTSGEFSEEAAGSIEQEPPADAVQSMDEQSMHEPSPATSLPPRRSKPRATLRVKRKPGLLKKFIFTVFLLAFAGTAGFAGYAYFIAEEPGLPFDIELSDIRLPDIKFPDIKLPEIKLPAFAKEFLEKYFPEEPGEEEVSEPERTAPPPSPAPPSASALPEKPAKAEARGTTNTHIASQPAPRLPRVIKKPKGSSYYVQFGAFKSEDNALNFKNKLQESGLKVFLKTIRSNDTSLNYVLLKEKFSSQESARKEAEQIKASLGLASAIYKD